MRLLPTLLFGATGCAQVFGIDTTTGRDADPSRVSVQFQRVSIGATVNRGPLDLSMQTATFLSDDGAGGFTKVPGDIVPPDMFAGAIPSGTPSALFTLPDQPTPLRRLWALPARNQRGNFGVYEHASPQPPGASSRIVLQITLPSPYAVNEGLRVEAIGAWANHGVMAPAAGTVTFGATLDYSTFGRMIGNMPITRITSADVVVIERYVGNQLNAVYQAPGFDQSDADDTITASMSALTPNLPLMASVTPSAYAQRFSAVRPAVGAPTMSWGVTAAPGHSIGSNAGVQLHAGAVAAVDTAIATMFANPFESLGWRALVQMTATSSRPFMFMGIATTLYAQMYTIAEPASNLTFDLPAGLPISLRANMMPLTTDGMTVPLDLTRPVEFDAQTDRANNSFYLVSVYEMALSSDMTTVERHHVVDVATAGEPKVKLPGDLFQVDHYYYLTFRSMNGGYLNAATGDLQTLTLPYSFSGLDSAVFKVVAP